MVMDWVTRWEEAGRGRTSSLSAEPILLTVMKFRWLHSPAKKNETENFSANTGNTDSTESGTFWYIFIQNDVRATFELD